MDERKDENISVFRGDLGESTVTVSETPVESMACEAQVGEVEGSNEARGREDVMLEAVGSRVLVDGVCSRENGVRVEVEEHLNDEKFRNCGCGGSAEAGVERDLRSISVVGPVVGDSGDRESEISDGEASSHGLEAGVRGLLAEEIAAGESFEKNKGVIGSDRAGCIVHDMSAHENGVQNDGVQDRGIRNRVEGSNADVGSTVGETQVVHTEDIGVVSGEEGLERGFPNVDAKRASEMVSGAGSESQGSVAENVVGHSMVVFGYVREETLIVEEVDRESENAEVKELVKGAEQGMEIDADGKNAKELVKVAEKVREMNAAGEDAHRDVETQNLGNTDDETLNHGDRITVTVEYSSVQKQVVEEAAVMVDDEGSNPKVDAVGIDSTEGITTSSEEKKIPTSEAEDRGTGNDSVISAHSNFLDEPNPVVTRAVPEMDKEEFTCSAVEDSLSFCHPTQEVGCEDTMKDKNVHPDKNHKQLQFEGCFNQGTTHYVALVDSKTTHAMEMDEQITKAEMDEILACSGNVQNFKDGKLSMDTELVTQITGRGDDIPMINNQEVLNSNVKVQMPTENNQQLKLEERLDMSGACHLAQPQVASNAGKYLVEHDVNDAEQINSDVGNGMEPQNQSTCEVVSCEVTLDVKVSSNPIVEVPCFPVQVIKEDEGLQTAEGDKSTSGGLSLVVSTVGHEMQVEEHVTDTEKDAVHGEQEMEVEEHDSDTEQPETNEKFVNRVTTMAESLVKSHQGSYLLPLEDGEICVSDLVWGKVRSHPWWPGQIYDPPDASVKAMKYHKKDCFLVAYFGDRTFAWVEASQLKPFYSHFSQVEKQSNAEMFQNAVDCALEEVSRRVEMGLACHCITNDVYNEIRFQIVENAGIRQESSVREGVNKSASAQSFQPDKLVEYVKALALSPSGGADRLELVIAKAQLLSFYRLMGYCELPKFQFCGGLVEYDVDTSHFVDEVYTTPFSKDDEHILSGKGSSETQRSSYPKRKHNLKDSVYPRKKEKRLSDLMTGLFDSVDHEFDYDGKAGGKLVSPSYSKKRKVVDFVGDDSSQDGRKTISLAKVSSTTPHISQPSFKIGECIRRVASQMTGSPSVLKSNSERLQKVDGDGSDVSFENFVDAEGKRVILPTDYSSLDDLLSQLHLSARDPMKGYSFLNIVISFFSDFRNSIISDRHAMDKLGGKRKKSSQILGSPETFEFEEMGDTYWTDRVVHNGSEEQPSAPPAPAATGKNSRGYQIVPVELKPALKSRRSYSRKQYSDANHDLTPSKLPAYADENAPAELKINFSGMDAIPSETNLNKMFRCFGPLKESETEIDRESSCARVVFKKCADAEVAHSSAPKFNIFGPIVVNYQLSYNISESFKALPIVTSLGEEYAT